MNEIDRLASRYSELSGKHVAKVPQNILDMEAAYQELIEDYVEMCKGKENHNHCERVYRASLKLRRILTQYYADNGLELPKYLTGAAKPEKPRAPRHYVSSLAAPSRHEGFPPNANAGKPRNNAPARRARV